jgi:hypothetical protein
MGHAMWLMEVSPVVAVRDMKENGVKKVRQVAFLSCIK